MPECECGCGSNTSSHYYSHAEESIHDFRKWNLIKVLQYNWAKRGGERVEMRKYKLMKLIYLVKITCVILICI